MKSLRIGFCDKKQGKAAVLVAQKGSRFDCIVSVTGGICGMETDQTNKPLGDISIA
jgi:hypothetical protein